MDGHRRWAYFSKEDFPYMSGAYIVVAGRHGKIKDIKSNRLYFVVEGKGEFIINDKPVKVAEGDVIIIPNNTPYDFKGNMRLFLVNSPAFDPKTDIKLE